MKRNGLEQTRKPFQVCKCVQKCVNYSMLHKALSILYTFTHLHTTFFKNKNKKNNMVETLCTTDF